AFPRILRPAPISTLFPYTTLFRSLCQSDCCQHRARCASAIFQFRLIARCAVARKHCTVHVLCSVQPCLVRLTAGTISRDNSATRSEEHTSELQSRFDLVCRLLLEK